MSENNFDGVSGVNGIVCNSGSGRVKFIDNVFKRLSMHAITIQFDTSYFIVRGNSFSGLGVTPVVSKLIKSQSQRGVDLSGNKSFDNYQDCNFNRYLSLLADGNKVTNYNKINPLNYPDGKTVYYSSGVLPEGTAGSTDSIVEVVRHGADSGGKVVMTVTPLSYDMEYPPHSSVIPHLILLFSVLDGDRPF